jgi:hypothetical protein
LIRRALLRFESPKKQIARGNNRDIQGDSILLRGKDNATGCFNFTDRPRPSNAAEERKIAIIFRSGRMGILFGRTDCRKVLEAGEFTVF